MAVNPEWFNSTGGANFVVRIASNVTGVSTLTCNPSVFAVVPATATAATAYTIPLTSFNGQIGQNCGSSSVTSSQILAAPIIQVDFQADGGSAAVTGNGHTSTTNRNVLAGGMYPTTINVVGTVQFQ